MVTKIVYLISGIDKALAFEWLAAHLSKRYEIYFIFLNKQEGETERNLHKNGIKCFNIPYRGKKDMLPGSLKVFKLLKKIKPNIVHTHLFEASLIGLAVARVLKIPRRIYTRHHGTIHHQYFPRAVFYDKLINSLATHIIAISRGVEKILLEMENVQPHRVKVIPHGFDLELFSKVERGRIIEVKRGHHIPEKDAFIIGVISRYTEWKGIQYIIPAFLEIWKQNPEAHLVLANSRGDYAAQVQEMLKKLPAGSYTEIPFENDVVALYHCFDIFLHVPVDPLCEAFGQTYVEALAAGVPAVFTLSGIAQEFIRDQHNAMVVPYRDAKAIEDAVTLLKASPRLRNKLRENGKKEVAERFALQNMVQDLIELYEA